VEQPDGDVVAARDRDWTDVDRPLQRQPTERGLDASDGHAQAPGTGRANHHHVPPYASRDRSCPRSGSTISAPMPASRSYAARTLKGGRASPRPPAMTRVGASVHAASLAASNQSSVRSNGDPSRPTLPTSELATVPGTSAHSRKAQRNGRFATTARILA